MRRRHRGEDQDHQEPQVEAVETSAALAPRAVALRSGADRRVGPALAEPARPRRPPTPSTRRDHVGIWTGRAARARARRPWSPCGESRTPPAAGRRRHARFGRTPPAAVVRLVVPLVRIVVGIVGCDRRRARRRGAHRADARSCRKTQANPTTWSATIDRDARPRIGSPARSRASPGSMGCPCRSSSGRRTCSRTSRRSGARYAASQRSEIAARIAPARRTGTRSVRGRASAARRRPGRGPRARRAASVGPVGGRPRPGRSRSPASSRPVPTTIAGTGPMNAVPQPQSSLDERRRRIADPAAGRGRRVADVRRDERPRGCRR